MILKAILYFRIIYEVVSESPDTGLDIHLDLLSKLNSYLLLTREEPVDEFPANTTHNRKIWDIYYLCLQKQYEAIGSKELISQSNCGLKAPSFASCPFVSIDATVSRGPFQDNFLVEGHQVFKIFGMFYHALAPLRPEVLVPEAISILEGENVHMECRVCLFPGDDLGAAEWYWYFMPVPIDEWTVKDHKGKLSLYGVRLEEAGLYECRIGATRSRPYFLHVAPDSEPVSEVKPRSARTGPYPAPPKIGTPGLSAPDATRWEGNIGSEPALSPSGRWGMYPSRSLKTPRVWISSNYLLRDYLVGVLYCLGLFSTQQGPPPLPPLPGRLTVYAQLGSPLSLSCPGHNLCDLPYRWGIGRKAKLAPWIAKSKSLGRVTVNAKQQLVFNSIQPDDEKLYSCWQGDSLAGVVRLLVVDERKVPVNHHLIIFGTLLILSTFFYVFVRIYMNRQRAASVYY
ncbi:unnamed protein product [Nezara viridula]|uniref:Ig-like domain-containing protein n=1 Tax=Nezara viridula TaxID=85310 RepID=A0A9P0HLH2_NEZVI|nr:unnamed protein product [Nezara viridula]